MASNLIGLLLSLVLVWAPASNRGDDPTQAPPIYKAFLGQWTGESLHFESGKKVHEFVDLLITYDTSKNKLRLEYSYRGSKTVNHLTKFLSLDVLKNIMTIQFDGEDVERYAVVGLKHLNQTGYGDFTGRELGREYPNSDSVHIAFHIQKDTFAYEWEFAYDGRNYAPYTRLKFKRVI